MLVLYMGKAAGKQFTGKLANKKNRRTEEQKNKNKNEEEDEEAYANRITYSSGKMLLSAGI